MEDVLAVRAATQLERQPRAVGVVDAANLVPLEHLVGGALMVGII